VSRAALTVAFMLVLSSCRADHRAENGAASNDTTRRTSIALTDDDGQVIRLAAPARRVISLIPSVTETLIALGATDQIVGRTRYDVASEVAGLPSVGGGIDPSIEAIVALHPDLVLAWENDKRQQVRTKLIAVGVPVFTLRTEDTTDVFRGVAHLGQLVGRDSAAAALVTSIRADLSDIHRAVAGRPRRSVFYVVFNDPPMTAGPNTFISQLIGIAGGRSIFDDAQQLWPTVSMEEIVRRQPDVLIVPTGEFKTNSIERFRAHAGWRDLRAVREGHIVTVPANLMNRPGANIGKAARVLLAALFPELESTHDSTTNRTTSGVSGGRK
jgi:iron complex transport system substrate-binding protein